MVQIKIARQLRDDTGWREVPQRDACEGTAG